MRKDKRAVVFGAGGSVGAAVAKEFAAAGAQLFLAGRSPAGLRRTAAQIAAAGGQSHESVVDALDDAAVHRYLDEVVRRAGGLDIALNAVGPRTSEYGLDKLALDLPLEEFPVPLNTVVKAQFISARADGPAREAAVARLAGLSFLKLPARVADTARAAVLVASPQARMITGTVVNATAGAALD